MKRLIKTPSKQRERTEATQAKLLEAAEAIFTRDGFSEARLEHIAEAAGYTRGAIYTHYKSKEDLFLVLFEQRAKRKLEEFCALLGQRGSTRTRVQKFRAMLVERADDRSWAILILEFKLFALRQPRLRARLRRVHAMLHTGSGEEFLQRLFGELNEAELRLTQQRLSLISAFVSAAVLESHFRPELLVDEDLKAILGEVLTVLVRR